ncbi:MAG: hypothetical protein HC860_19230 [Alkalinema sp. RU_4_3]|nr:hypothetical protein [Alkalinema sp. RU_4_3]
MGTPIVDFSISPEQVYQRISASDFRSELGRDRIVLIAVSDDDYRLGWEPGKPDRVPAPPAFHYLTEGRGSMTGGEVLAYMTHHLPRGTLSGRSPSYGWWGLQCLRGRPLWFQNGDHIFG